MFASRVPARAHRQVLQRLPAAGDPCCGAEAERLAADRVPRRVTAARA